MKPVKVLVTGGTGLVGSAFLKELQNHPHEVTLLTRTAKNIASTGKRKIKLVAADITDKSSLKRIKTHFDVIFHLAAAKRMFEKKGELKDTNIHGLENVLEAFCSHGKDTLFIFASSIDAAVRNSDYGKTKLVGEAIVKDFAQKNPLVKWLNLRIGNVDFPNLNKLSGWRKCLLYHELGDKYVYPIKLERLVKKIVGLIQKPKLFGQTIEVFDRKVKVANLIKTPPLKLRFGRLWLSIWHFLGRVTRRGDLLIYLKSQND